MLCVIIAWGSGYSVRQRRRYAVRLQDEAASKAVAQERLRIARELHDVVAHSMSVIAVQAGYGQYVIDRQPGDARAALGAIQTTSREALDEMRRMLGALRQADDADARGDGTGLVPAGSGLPEGPPAPSGGASVPLFPAPGLADLDRLVARTAGAGVRVDLTRFGRPRDLPASIDLSAYRIVQEALTNVVKHARTSSCRVLLGYRDDELTIEVTDNGAGMPAPELAGAGVSRHGAAGPNGTALMSQNGLHDVGVLDGAQAPPDDGPAPVASLPRAGRPMASLPGAGHGIIGMRERVTLLGGEFSAGPLPGYGFRVSARIPLPAAERMTGSAPIRVVVTDDQALVRVGFCGIISATPGFIVVGEAGNGAEAVEVARRTRPDVILMDVRMPVMNGIEATRQITQSTDVRALILTTFDLDEYVFAALRAGASGFLLKDTLPAELLTAIRVVAAGDALLAPSVTRRLIGEFARTTPQPGASEVSGLLDPAVKTAVGGRCTTDLLARVLTEREREVLTMVARGLSNAEIAEELTISPATAKTHVAHLLTKLDARDRIQLVIMAYQSGLTTLQ